MAGDDNEIKYFFPINYNYVIDLRREDNWCTYGAQRILLPRGTDSSLREPRRRPRRNKYERYSPVQVEYSRSFSTCDGIIVARNY